jgi:glycosyltransferase involved in cell wall biosynthesis
LNILFPADVSIADIIGGAERVLYEQTTRLARRGHNIFIITRKLRNHAKDHEVIKGVNEWRYVCNQRDPLSFLRSTLINSKRLFETLHERNKYDCINFHQPFSALGINLSKNSRDLQKIYTCHSLSFEEFLSRNGKSGGIIRKVSNYILVQARKRIEMKGLKHSDQIIVLSRFTKEKLIDVYDIESGKIKMIPGGVDLEQFNPAVDKIEIRKKLNISQDKIILFTIRNLVHRMGLENLIIAFSEITKERSDIYLVIGGKGPLKDKLIDLTRHYEITDKVHFAGFIAEDNLPLYYQMADLFVLPTKELEGFGLVTLEAMSSGLPVVGSPIGGTKEILGNFDSRFLFKGTDSNSIAESILENYDLIKQNPQKWKEISHQCRNFVESNYSWEKNIDSLEELFTNTAHK